MQGKWNLIKRLCFNFFHYSKSYVLAYQFINICKSHFYNNVGRICLTFRLVPESPRWLVAQERYEEAEAILQKVAEVNGNEIPRHLDLEPEVSGLND